MTQRVTPKMMDALRLLNENPAAKVHHKLLEALIKRSLARLTPNGHELTTIGRRFLQASEATYIIEQWHKTKDKEGIWQVVHSPNGEKLTFATEEEAERHAAQLSIVNYTDFRVIAEGDAPDIFIIYSFGKRYTQYAASGVRTLHPR